MSRFYCTLAAGVLLVTVPALSAGAEEKKAGAPASPSAPADQAPAAQPASQPAPPAQSAPPARAQEIEELRRTIEELRRRLEELEKRPAQPQPAPTDPAPADPTLVDPTPPPPRTSGPFGVGGATFLPNISIIGNLVARAGDTKAIPGRGRSHFEELEIAFQDAVTPKMRYDVFLSAEKEEDWRVGLEEGFLTATGVLPGVNVRAGRIRSPFGRLNPLHPHQWRFITQPAVQRALMGTHGLIGDGISAQYVFPTRRLFAGLEVGRWETVGIHGHEEEGEHEEEGGHEEGEIHEEDLGFRAGQSGAYSARLLLAKEVGRNRDLEIGFSRYWGRGEVEGFGRRRQALNGIDFSYRSYPGAYRRLWLLGELVASETQGINGDTKYRPGAYVMLANKWNRYWEAGIRADYTKYPFPVQGKEYGASVFLTRFLTEQTSLRLEYRWARLPEYGATNAVYLQLLFGSGPHTHELQ